MKILLLLLIPIIMLSACGGKAAKVEGEEQKIDYDFRSFRWDDLPVSVLDAEAPKKAKIIDSNNGTEYEFEDIFLGVKTELQLDNVARMSCFFAETKLKAAWYYIYTTKDKFDLNKEVEQLKAKNGAPDSLHNDITNQTTNYLWFKDRTVIKLTTRDAVNKFRFELYYYDRKWYNENLKK